MIDGLFMKKCFYTGRAEMLVKSEDLLDMIPSFVFLTLRGDYGHEFNIIFRLVGYY